MARKDKRAPEPQKKKKPTKTPEQLLAEKIRYHKSLDSRWAVLDEARVEYFRGKDFQALIRKHPELAHSYITKEQTTQLDIPLDQFVMEVLLSSRLAIRCDRVNKAVRPGKKKLSKWPGRLSFHNEQEYATDEGFYSWTFERQQPIWQTILTILFPIFTVACCLFPVFPYWAKLTVLYFLLSLIAAIVLLLFVRVAIFTVVYITTGKRVWFFPRILEEEGTLQELFQFWPLEDKDPRAKLTTRLGLLVVLVFTGWLMVTYAPDENTRAKYTRKVTNIIDDFITWTPQMISGNTTAPDNSTASTGAFNTSSNQSTTGEGRATQETPHVVEDLANSTGTGSKDELK